jgi:phosphoribosylformylglycinamidine synthase
VKRALGGLGFHDLVDLRVGKVLEVEVDSSSPEGARARVEEMCRRLLANPILEDYSVEMVDEVAGRPAGR